MWPQLIIAAGSALANYMASQNQEPTKPANPSSYFGADGAMQVWNPGQNGYWSIGARTPSDQLSTNWTARLLQNKLMGGGGWNQTMSDMSNELRNLQTQQFNGMPGQAYSEIQRRIADLKNIMAGMHDVNLSYSPIGVNSDTDLLRYRAATDTVNNYLTGTLDKGYADARAAAAQSNAARGMGQSTMADWGQNKMASQYALDKTGVAMQSESYMRGLQQQDEAAKLSILNAAQSGLGLNASMAQGANAAASAQMSLAQQMAGYNSQMQNNWQNAHDKWASQNRLRPWQAAASGIASGIAGLSAGSAGSALGNTPGWGNWANWLPGMFGGNNTPWADKTDKAAGKSGTASGNTDGK